VTQTYAKDALAGRIVVVTGGGRGIGSGISKVVASAGGEAVIIYPTDGERVHADKVIAEIESKGGKASAYKCDVGVQSECSSVIAQIVKDKGRVDALVNNAGICDFTEFENITPEIWARHIAVNLSGPFFLSQAVVKDMKPRKKGAIVNISTVSAYRGGDRQVHYISSKGGLSSLTTSLAHEISSTGVRVNAILCGGVATDINIKQFEDREKATGKPFQERPGVRSLGKPEDLGSAVVFLISDASEWVTGSLVAVDGGALIS
jgi:NAD(P)-dependent dehydrogenase (short-subunit alcohol dehydrogenase family)